MAYPPAYPTPKFTQSSLASGSISAFQQALLGWYARHARPLPWRQTRNPYAIWLAEVMLQQTTVAAVIPYYHRFLESFPTVQALAEAPIERVLHLWQGLGYYRRAHMLHRCAQTVVNAHGGHFPTHEAELLALPGFGPYTAAAVASQAFNQPAAAVDGNVERTLSRLFAIETPLPTSKPQLRALARTLQYEADPHSWTNALIEHGATVCTPKNPLCLTCPVSEFCQALEGGSPTAYPLKDAKKASPHKHGTAYILTDEAGHIWLRQRPTEGLLGGLWEVPHSGWEDSTDLPMTTPGIQAGSITHTFTHFKLTLSVVHHVVPEVPPQNRFELNNLPPLPTLMKKVLKTVFPGQIS